MGSGLVQGSGDGSWTGPDISRTSHVNIVTLVGFCLERNKRAFIYDFMPNGSLDKFIFSQENGSTNFGLAKLWLNKESIVSMMGAKGTVGYIALEVFRRNFGGASHKFDVYNYGMLALEMVRGRRNIDSTVSHTSEIYFPYWIYEDVEMGKDLRVLGVITEEEKEIARKMVLVSLWCI
nr:PR5-like receptor kinase [Ziziphus jujuba var. spinosa]